MPMFQVKTLKTIFKMWKKLSTLVRSCTRWAWTTKLAKTRKKTDTARTFTWVTLRLWVNAPWRNFPLSLSHKFLENYCTGKLLRLKTRVRKVAKNQNGQCFLEVPNWNAIRNFWFLRLVSCSFASCFLLASRKQRQREGHKHSNLAAQMWSSNICPLEEKEKLNYWRRVFCLQDGIQKLLFECCGRAVWNYRVETRTATLGWVWEKGGTDTWRTFFR